MPTRPTTAVALPRGPHRGAPSGRSCSTSALTVRRSRARSSKAGGKLIGPDFSFVDARNGDEEGVRSQGANRSVYAKRGAAGEVTKPLPAKKDGVIDAGFDVYVRTHWDTVGKAGGGIPFLLPGRFAFYNVRLVDGETTGGLRRMTMKLDAWYAFAAPTVVLSYTTTDRTLRRFEGMGSIRGENGKLRAVRIEFPRTSARAISPTPPWTRRWPRNWTVAAPSRPGSCIREPWRPV